MTAPVIFQEETEKSLGSMNLYPIFADEETRQDKRRNLPKVTTARTQQGWDSKPDPSGSEDQTLNHYTVLLLPPSSAHLRTQTA